MTKRILVVEDEASNMHVIAMSLALLGYGVIEASDPEAGLALAVSEQPDVILMDLTFAGSALDGLEAIRRLKAHPLTCTIPVVAQTASVLDYAQAAVAAAGGDALLHKPFKRKQLVEALLAVMPGAVVPGAASPGARFAAHGPADTCIRHTTIAANGLT